MRYRLLYADGTWSCDLLNQETAKAVAGYMDKTKQVVAIIKISIK